MKQPIGFIGYGALGRQIAFFLRQTGISTERFIFFDDTLSGEKVYRFNAWKEKRFRDMDFVVSIGYKHLNLKNDLIHELLESKRSLYSFIHPSSFINPSAQIGKGVIVYPMCNVDQHAELKDGAFLNNSVCVSHNSIIGNSCFLAPGVVVSGNVCIDNSTFIGIGSIISNGIRIGSNCIIGAGSMVSKDIDSNQSAIGNPLRILSKPLNIV